MTRDEYPENKAVEVWERGGLTFSILKVERSYTNHHCGYVRFPKRPVKEHGYDGILRYAPVHGGLTYASSSKDGSMVYGFDCAHADDENRPELQDRVWLRQECERMATAIQTARDFEDKFLLAEGGEPKANVVTEYHTALADKGIQFNLTDNFGAMIGVLGGLRD